MNKNFGLRKTIILTKDHGYFGEGSTGIITAYLPDDNKMAVYWERAFVPIGMEDDVVKDEKGHPILWVTYQDIHALDDYGEVVENEGEYLDLVERMGWELEEEEE